MKQFLIVALSVITTSCFSQTWTPIPFNQGSSAGTMTVCSGGITITITDAFVNALSDGSVNLSTITAIDFFGSMTFSTPITIRIVDLSSTGSNNGDTWNIVAAPGVAWVPFGSEASSSGTNLNLVLTSTAVSSGGATTTPTSSLSFTKSVQGGAVYVQFDSGICVSLPIELTNFTAELENSAVKLNWQTASEKDNDYFTVERSSNGMIWETVIVIDGAGTSSTTLSYAAVDRNPLEGKSYYRLKQTDFDGEVSYSDLRFINFSNANEALIDVYPNPTEDRVILRGNSLEIVSIQIFDVLGKDVTSNTQHFKESDTSVIIDLSVLEEGFYYLKTKTNTKKVYKK